MPNEDLPVFSSRDSELSNGSLIDRDVWCVMSSDGDVAVAKLRAIAAQIDQEIVQASPHAHAVTSSSTR